MLHVLTRFVLHVLTRFVLSHLWSQSSPRHPSSLWHIHFCSEHVHVSTTRRALLSSQKRGEKKKGGRKRKTFCFSISAPLSSSVVERKSKIKKISSGSRAHFRATNPRTHPFVENAAGEFGFAPLVERAAREKGQQHLSEKASINRVEFFFFLLGCHFSRLSKSFSFKRNPTRVFPYAFASLSSKLQRAKRVP